MISSFNFDFLELYHVHVTTQAASSLCISLPDNMANFPRLRFKVEDSKYTKDALAAWACIRLDRLRAGFRFVRLLDAKGLATAGLLLVKVEKTIL